MIQRVKVVYADKKNKRNGKNNPDSLTKPVSLYATNVDGGRKNHVEIQTLLKSQSMMGLMLISGFPWL